MANSKVYATIIFLQGMGPETISVKQVHEGYTALYYVYDYSNRVGSAISWKDSQAKATIFGPNGSGQVRVYKQVILSIAMAVITCHF